MNAARTKHLEVLLNYGNNTAEVVCVSVKMTKDLRSQRVTYSCRAYLLQDQIACTCKAYGFHPGNPCKHLQNLWNNPDNRGSVEGLVATLDALNAQ